MAEPRRIQRLQQLVLEVVAETIQREVQDPRIGMVTITRVVLAKDLSAAKVHWSSIGTDPERRTSERGLKNALPLIQRRVAEAMQTRVTPALTLQFDPGLERQQHLEDIFRRLRDERGEPALAEGQATSTDAPIEEGAVAEEDVPEDADPDEPA